ILQGERDCERNDVGREQYDGQRNPGALRNRHNWIADGVRSVCRSDFPHLHGASTNLNLPIPASGTVIANFMTGAAGNYAWLCTSPCGSGVNGTAGAMITPGWMDGTLAVG